jgi:hypothetical protein
MSDQTRGDSSLMVDDQLFEAAQNGDIAALTALLDELTPTSYACS